MRVAAQSAPADANGASSMVPLDEGELDKLKVEVGKAFGLLKGLFAEGKLPVAEQLAAARSATEFALRSVADFRPAADAPDAFKQASGSASQIAGNALKLLQGLPGDAKSVGAALDKLGGMIAELTAAPAPATPSANDVGSNQPKTIEQAPLTANNAAVIIRAAIRCGRSRAAPMASAFVTRRSTSPTRTRSSIPIAFARVRSSACRRMYCRMPKSCTASACPASISKLQTTRRGRAG